MPPATNSAAASAAVPPIRTTRFISVAPRRSVVGAGSGPKGRTPFPYPLDQLCGDVSDPEDG